MSEAIYEAIAHAELGFVEAPAGCGKTEAIVRTVAKYCVGRQLILTHTHAGVDALRRRFRGYCVPSEKYHVDTIAGWCWSWIQKYPNSSGYSGSLEIADWDKVYSAMKSLLKKKFVRSGISNSYSGIIVDEYQDCTVPMHEVVLELKTLLPCRILGDDLQSIFGFRDEPTIPWSDVYAAFENKLGLLEEPHRWINAGNEKLGRWLLDSRSYFSQGREPEYGGSPAHQMQISYKDLSSQLTRISFKLEGSVCVVGPKMRRLSANIESTLTNRRFRVLESNELPELKDLIEELEKSGASKPKACLKFFENTHVALGDDYEFIEKILLGLSQRPVRSDRKALCQKHSKGVTPELLLDLIRYIEQLKIRRKLSESVSALQCILEMHLEKGISIKQLYTEEISKRKLQGRSGVYRCIGSTLLVKGLEFDHVVILRDSNWLKSWGGYRDLYVALTRGSKSVTLLDLTR